MLVTFAESSNGASQLPIPSLFLNLAFEMIEEWVAALGLQYSLSYLATEAKNVAMSTA